jgi:hypothetical protein
MKFQSLSWLDAAMEHGFCFCMHRCIAHVTAWRTMPIQNSNPVVKQAD